MTLGRAATRRIAAVALALLVAVLAWRFPVTSPALCIGLLGYACALLWREDLWLLVIPALLPVLDFTPWTGRQFFDEFDLFVLATIALWWWRPTPLSISEDGRQASLGGARPALAALGLSYIVAAAIAALEPPVFHEAIGCHPYNICATLRGLKGFAWAVLLLGPLRITLARSSMGFTLLAVGMLLGLLGESLAIAFERLVFTGLWNFDAPFRVTGTFSSLHTGGQHLDAYLAAAVPFVVLMLTARFGSRLLNAAVSALGLALFTLAIYAVLVTFSRGLLVAVGIGLAVLALGAPRVYKQRLASRVRVLATAATVLAATGASLAVALDGDYFKHRFSLISRDVELRSTHWRSALSLMSPNPSSQLLGMGLASYPRSFAFASDARHRPASYQLRETDGDRKLLLRGGNPIYFEQRVHVEPDTRYEFAADVAASGGHARLLAVLCEKSLQYSFRCSGAKTRVAPAVDLSRAEHVIHTRAVGRDAATTLGLTHRRPVTLALFVPDFPGEVWLDNVELLGPDGKNLLRNGNFSEGTNHWYFSADDADAWHIANLWLHLLFEQGLLGAAAFTVLMGAAMARAIRAAFAGSGRALVLTSSLTGVLLIGALGSLLDAPRISLLIYLLTFSAALSPAVHAAPDPRPSP